MSYSIPAANDSSYAGVVQLLRSASTIVNPLHFIKRATSSAGRSGSYLRLCTYPYQGVLCLCLLSMRGSLAASSAILPVSIYLQSPPATAKPSFNPLPLMNLQIRDFSQTHHHSILRVKCKYGPNIRRSRCLSICRLLSQPVLCVVILL